MLDGIPECVATLAAKDRAMAYWTDPANFPTVQSETDLEFNKIIERNF